MTPLPKRRWSTQRQGKKRATLKAGTVQLVKCPNCSGMRINHAACPSCGFYNGKQVLKIKVKKEKKPTSEGQ